MSDGPSAPYSTAEQSNAARLFEQHYDFLVRVARSKRRRANLNDTMATTDVVHDAYMKLRARVDWVCEEQFLGSAVLAIRQVIIDHARRNMSAKRGGDVQKVPLDGDHPVLPEFSETPEQIVMISELLQQLEAENPRWLKIVDARYFGGLTEEETAALLGVSSRTVRRDWSQARRWIAKQLNIAVD